MVMRAPIVRLCALLTAIAIVAACDNGAPASTHVRLQLKVSREGRPHHPVSIEAFVVNDGAFAVNHATGPPGAAAVPAQRGLWFTLFDSQGHTVYFPPCEPHPVVPGPGNGFSSFLLPGESIQASMEFGDVVCESIRSEHMPPAGTYRVVASFRWSGSSRFDVVEQRQATFIWRAE